MTSVLRLMGRGRPCSFRKSPQALQRTEPDSSRRQSGVVLVVQFWQTGYVLMPNTIVRRSRLKIVMEMYHIDCGDRDKDKGTEISSRP